MAFTRCILFTRYTREQNTTCKGHLAFQKATISLENDVHTFFSLPLTFITINVRHIQFLQERIVEENEQLGLKSLFNRWYMAKISLIMFYNWMAATIGYYGLGMFSVHLAGDIYINFVLSALIEIPSYIFCILCSET